MWRLTAAILILAACQGAETADTCGASDYASFIGTNIAAITLPADLDHRVVGPDSILTQDFVETRLNINVDENGVIQSLTCG